MTIEEAFGAVIRRLRREHNLSQEKFALLSGLDRSFISNIEGGKQQPSLLTIFTVANAVNILPSIIMKEVELLLKFYHPNMFKSELNRWEFDWVDKIENITEVNSNYYKGSETILVVDDEIYIRDYLSSLLTDYGYKVMLAQDGHDAFIKYKQYNSEIKLIIMDVVMPENNSNDIYEAIKSINPKLSIILMTGYLANDISWLDEKKVIYKPFSPLDMLGIVRSTLDTSS